MEAGIQKLIITIHHHHHHERWLQATLLPLYTWRDLWHIAASQPSELLLCKCSSITRLATSVLTLAGHIHAALTAAGCEGECTTAPAVGSWFWTTSAHSVRRPVRGQNENAASCIYDAISSPWFCHSGLMSTDTPVRKRFWSLHMRSDSSVAEGAIQSTSTHLLLWEMPVCHLFILAQALWQADISVYSYSDSFNCNVSERPSFPREKSKLNPIKNLLRVVLNHWQWECAFPECSTPYTTSISSQLPCSDAGLLKEASSPSTLPCHLCEGPDSAHIGSLDFFSHCEAKFVTWNWC